MPLTALIRSILAFRLASAPTSITLLGSERESVAGLSGSWGPVCGHPVQPGARFCAVCGQLTGAAEVPAAPGSQSPAAGQPVPGRPAQQAALPPAPQAGATRAEPGFPSPMPPPPSGSPRPLPAPPGAQPPGNQLPGNQPPAADTQWFWDAPEPPPVPQAPAPWMPGTPPATPPGFGGPRETLAPSPAAAPYGSQPPYGAQPPYGPPQGYGTDPYGPAQQGSGPGQSSGAASGPGGWPPGPSDTTSTLPGMPRVGGPGGWDHGGGGPGGPRRRLPRGPLVPAIATGALIVVVAAIIVAVRGGSPAPNAAAAGTTASAGATPASAPAAPSAAARERQATQLAGLLAQNNGNRSAVDNAYYAAAACKTLPRDRQVFTGDAAKRESLVAKLAALDHSALNPAMIQDLNGGWQASAQADTDYAKWAASLEGHCRPAKTASNPHYLAANGPDSTATNDKMAFTRLWNPLARKYGLPTYSYTQL